jgi:hypothetical protein
VGGGVELVLREAVTLPCCVRENSCCSELHRRELYPYRSGMGMGGESVSVLVFSVLFFCSSLSCSPAYRLPARYRYTADRSGERCNCACIRLLPILFSRRLQPVWEQRGRMGRY